MEIQGKIKLIKEVQEISPTFKKRELILTTDEQYPQTLSVEFIQDKTDLLNNFEVNQSVKVGINLRGTSPRKVLTVLPRPCGTMMSAQMIPSPKGSEPQVCWTMLMTLKPIFANWVSNRLSWGILWEAYLPRSLRVEVLLKKLFL